MSANHLWLSKRLRHRSTCTNGVFGRHNLVGEKLPTATVLVVVTPGGALYLAAKEGWAPAAFKASVRVILGGKLAGVLTLLP